jgi:dipeptidyl aminopeptidase/acylaminoacyl peptidase
MGEVYRARDARLDRDVAIKVLPTAFAQDPDRLARFEREGKAVAALSHPNIIAIFDVGAESGHAYAVMELLDGESLREHLSQGPLSVRKATECAIQIARGLAAAHDRGLVHRDLKPDNIFLLRDGRVKILDFGLARTTDAERPTDDATGVATVFARKTDAGTVMGTVGYMAPEQVRGQSVDGRADLFALGTVLYEMLTGRRAFERDTSADTMTAILKEEPPEFDSARGDIPPALDRIVRHCLEKNVVERFQSARDVAFALEALSGSAPVRAIDAAAANAAGPAKSRRALIAAVVGLLVVAAGVGGGLAGRATAPHAAPPPRFTMKTFEPQTILVARFTPDGKGMVFSAARTGSAVQLFHIQPDLAEARPFGPPNTHLLSVSAKGELAVLTGAISIGQRLFKGTLARMAIDGSPRPWMENVREADWSPDGTTLAIVHDENSKDRLEYPIGTVLYETAGYVSDLRVSPDGSRVAFMDHQARFDDRGWVKVVDRDKKVTTLAGEFWGEESLAWSPDGKTVFFGANDRQQGDESHPGDLSYQIHSVAIAAPGTAVAALPSPGDFFIHDITVDGRWLTSREDIRLGVGAHLDDKGDRDLTWLNQNWSARLSRDGTRLLFGDGTAGKNYGVVWRPTDGAPIVRLGEGTPFGWSPDEQWVLALIFSPPQLLLYPVGAGEPIRLKRGAIAEYQGAAWFPDGKSVLIVGHEAGKPTRTFRQEIPAGDAKPILEEGVIAAAVTPDGQTVLALDRERKWRWYPVNGGPSRLAAGMTALDRTSGDPDTIVLGWSPDGKEVFVRGGSDVPARVDRLDILSGRRTLLAEIGPADRTGLFSFTPTNVTKNGKQYGYGYAKRLSTLFVVTPTR